jgi:uncharacterized protein YjbI with pentapeptide repeats
MANRAQLAQLKQGVEAWNQWLEAHRDIRPDLREANLRGTNLRGANLRMADLTWAHLEGASLTDADLRQADLSGAFLTDARLARARLTGANLHGAYLFRADLTGADLAAMDQHQVRIDVTGLMAAGAFPEDLVSWGLSSARPGFGPPGILAGARLTGAFLAEARLTGAHLLGADLTDADLRRADLHRAFLTRVNLSGAKLHQADLTEASLSGANLSGANLTRADLRQADLTEANLTNADFSGTTLTGALLIRTQLVGTNLENAVLTGSHIYGISAWNLKGEPKDQSSLVITPLSEPTVTVDNLEVAQFVYLLLNNQNIRNVVNTIAEKAVLILGRFTPERKAVLDAIREALRHRGFLPIMFDFERPTNRDFTETIMTLAGMCLFIIADITNPKSSPLELQAIVPNYMVPFVPIIQQGEQPFSMFNDLLGKFDWVLKPLIYDSIHNLVSGLGEAVIKPALTKHDELLAKRVAELRIRHIRDYL